ncbi:hypothetical protein HAX54_047586, partial [Datura stramonium]|nr:hypothetical protein [Datura stramonium]
VPLMKTSNNQRYITTRRERVLRRLTYRILIKLNNGTLETCVVEREDMTVMRICVESEGFYRFSTKLVPRRMIAYISRRLAALTFVLEFMPNSLFDSRVTDWRLLSGAGVPQHGLPLGVTQYSSNSEGP